MSRASAAVGSRTWCWSRQTAARPSRTSRTSSSPPSHSETPRDGLPAPMAMTGGDALVQGLLHEGVETVFALPGVQIYALTDALARSGIRVICPRHEQAAAYMAFGYARASGRAGVYAVVPGPGVLNSAAALSTAYATSTPVVCLTGEIPSAFVGRGMGHLHELPDQLATLRTLTKWAASVDEPGQAPALVARAFAQATGGHPRPVALAMPWDVLERTAPVGPPLSEARAAPALDGGAVERAASAIRAAANPMIMVGSGAFGAAAEVLGLAERIQAPVVAFRSGKGVVPSDHHLGFSCAEGFERWPQTDVLVGIGSRLELQWFRWPDQPPGLRIVDIDIDPAQPARVGAEVAVVADAATACAALDEALGSHRAPSRRGEFEALKAAKRAEIASVTPHVAFVEAIRDALPRDGFLVEELCQAGFASYFAFPTYEPRTFVTAG